MKVVATKGGRAEAVEISGVGTTQGFETLMKRTCDIAMASREANPAERMELQEAATQSGLSQYEEHIIGKDGIAVIVNRGNPLETISLDTLSTIFSGEKKNWSEVESTLAGPIYLTVLDKKSGTRAEFEKKVLELRKRKLSESLYFTHKSNLKISNKVSETQSAIGFVAFPFIGNAKALKISDGKDITPQYPDPQNIQSRSYRLSRELFLYTLRSAQGSLAHKFIEFAKTDEGQKIVKRVGFVPYKTLIESQVTQRSPEGIEDEYGRTAYVSTY
jgi:phosphate transport system substrate-binding protein